MPSSFAMSLLLATLMFALSTWRLYAVLPKKHRPRRSSRGTVAIFLGSGGHTSEALALMSSLDFRRYNRRIYITSEGDNLSSQKAIDLENKHPGPEEGNYAIITIPRARKVHQGLMTTPFSTGWSLLSCTYHLMLRPLLVPGTPEFADVLILNGPGTCFVLCIAVYFVKFLGLPAPIIIYVETFARVKSLSLSGKLVRPLADCFITQWQRGKNGQFNNENWLV